MHKILVVDDDRMNLIIAKKVLSSSYEVETKQSAQDALSYLEEEIPDLILLDIQMPEMDGFEMMKKIRNMPKICQVPVIFLTADRSEKTEESCFEVGAFDYISKPFVPSIMQKRIQRAVELQDYRKHLEKLVEEQLKKIADLQQEVIISMANLIESRDGTTGEHVKRTAGYVKLLINALKEKKIFPELEDPKYVDFVVKAAPMHDIGKIMIPDNILQKQDKLSFSEFEIMKLHTSHGGNLIKKNMSKIGDQKFVEIAFNLACYHHEKWNGNGYPKGLSGEDIPLCSRILAVADVFDALMSKRSYKKSFTLEETFEIMKSERNVSFQPEIIDTFLECEEELQFLLAAYGQIGEN